MLIGFTISDAIRIAGCNAATFRTWVNRNGLFANPDGSKSKRPYLTRADICALRLATIISENGLGAEVAVKIAMASRPWFDMYGEYMDAWVNGGPEVNHPPLLRFSYSKEHGAKLIPFDIKISKDIDFGIFVEMDNIYMYVTKKLILVMEDENSITFSSAKDILKNAVKTLEKYLPRAEKNPDDSE